jgi:hypothetical protein
VAHHGDGGRVGFDVVGDECAAHLASQ